MRKLLVLLFLLPSVALAQPIPGNTSSVTGAVTCNAGTNLNTSALATSAKQDTIISDVDEIESLLTTSNSTAHDIYINTQNIADWDDGNDRANVNLIAGQVGVAAGSGTANANTQRVVLATDVALPTGSNTIGNVTVSSSALPSGAATAAKQPALGTAGTASSDVLTVQGIASMTALKVDGSAVTQPISASSLPLPTGASTETTLGTRLSESDFDTKVGSLTESAPASDTASSGLNGRLQRVAQRITSLIALVPSALTGSGNFKVSLQESNATQAATQSGTWTVQPGNTANTTPWLVTQSPATSGGLTTYHLVSAASTNATVVKNSAGQLYGWYIYNSNASARKLAFHNTTSSPTAGASVFFTIMLPGGAAANVFTDSGIPFSTGIAITTVTDLADSGTTAVGANDLNINLFYK